MTVTACSTPGGIQTARDGGTMKLASGDVTRTTPVAERTTWPQGCECGTTRVSARRRCCFARTARRAVGVNRCGVSGPIEGRRGAEVIGAISTGIDALSATRRAPAVYDGANRFVALQ